MVFCDIEVPLLLFSEEKSTAKRRYLEFMGEDDDLKKNVSYIKQSRRVILAEILRK